MKSASLFLVYCLVAGGSARSTVFLGYQDSLGQYSFGYSAPGSARSEVRTSNGATRGTYSYVDETGVIQTAQYVADGENGFRVIATNLPQAPLPVQDTPEVMAARTAHLQALEMATRRDEEAHSHEEGSSQNAQAGTIERNHEHANIARIHERPTQIKSTENPAKEEKQTLSGNAEQTLQSDGEGLEAIASKNSAESGTNWNIREESTGMASQEIIGAANIPAIPLISSRLVVSPQSLGQHAVPVFQISHGSHEIEPSAIPESSIAQGHRDGASGIITPAGTALKTGTISIKKVAGTGQEQVQHGNKQVHAANNVIAPASIIPLSYSHSNFIRSYVSPATALHYITYNVL